MNIHISVTSDSHRPDTLHINSSLTSQCCCSVASHTSDSHSAGLPTVKCQWFIIKSQHWSIGKEKTCTQLYLYELPAFYTNNEIEYARTYARALDSEPKIKQYRSTIHRMLRRLRYCLCTSIIIMESLCKEGQQVHMKFMLFFAVYVTMTSSSTRQVF